MYKKFVNTIFFVLISIVLVSCRDPMCYEENDLGEYNTQAFNVEAAESGCTWTDDGKEGTAGTEVWNCMSQIVQRTVKAGSCSISGNFSCISLRSEALKSSTDHISNLVDAGLNIRDCYSLSSAELEVAFLECVNNCKSECEKNSESLYEPKWTQSVADYPEKTMYDNIVFYPNGQITVQALGTLTLRKTNEKNVAFNANTTDIQTTPVGYTSPFVTDSQNAFKIDGEWCIGGKVGSACPMQSRAGFLVNATDNADYIANNFLRRGVIILNNLPAGGFVNTNGVYSGPMLEPDFSYWSCQKPTTSQGSNSYNDYTCNTNYDNLSDTTYLSQNNALYPIENTFAKDYGGYVVPKNVINFITPNVPFQNIICNTNVDGIRECYNGILNDENSKIQPWTSNDANSNSLENIMKGDLLLTSDGLQKSFLYPSKLALKIPVSSNTVSRCSITVQAGSDSYTMELPADNKWHFLKDVNQERVTLNKHRFNTVSDNGQKMQDISTDQLYNVTISFDSNETWVDETGNSVKCGDGVVAFFMPQNEILINTSGFVSFKNLFAPTSSCSSAGCVYNDAYVNFTIINPLYSRRDNLLDTALSNNFYENINNKNNLSPKSNIVPLNLSDNSGAWSAETFVRKGQILRFDENNWYDINEDLGLIRNKTINLGNSIFKNISHGLVLKIRPRLSLFCKKDYTSENIISYDNDGQEIVKTIYAPQCYDLENYQGAFRNVFSGEIKGDASTYGTLTISSYDLGARKLSSISNGGTYGNLSSFKYNYDSENLSLQYVSDYILPANKILNFLVLDNDDFEFTGNSSLNGGEYQIVFQPIEYLMNGQQLAVAIADVSWNGEDTSNGTWNKSTHPVAWLTKYNMDKNSESYGTLEETGSNFEFNNLGWLVKKGTSNYMIDISSENFPNLSYIQTDQYSDLRLFFKIIDKYETCNNSKGANVTTTLCKCSGESDSLYRSCASITSCSGGIEQKDTVICSSDFYANNSGNYKVQLQSSRETSKILSWTETSLSSVLMDKIFKIFDGTNVRLKVNENGEKELCSYSNASDKFCSIFYEDNKTFRLDNGADCVMADNEGQTNGAKYCYNNCNSLTTNEQQRTLCRTFNDGKGFVKKFYQTIISDSTYQRVITISFALMFSFYGLYFLLGLADFNQEELIKKLIKISFVYLMISPTGWNYYEAYFVKFFKEGIDYLSFSIVSSFTDDIAINNAMATGNYTNKAVIFSSIDTSLKLIFSDEFTSRVWALLFTTFPGFVYIILIIWAVGIFLVSVITAMVIYSMSQVLVSFFLAFGPIFFAFLIFDKTKGMFDKWLSNLIGLSFEQIFVLTCASFFNVIVYNILKAMFSYKTCYEVIFSLLGIIDVEFWKASKTDIPGLLQILLIFLIAHLSKNFMKLMANLGAGIGGADISSTDISSGMVDTATGIVKPLTNYAKELPKKAGVAIAKTMGYQSDEDLKKENENNKIIRDGMATAGRAAANKNNEDMRNRFGKDWRKRMEDGDEEVKEAFEEGFKNRYLEEVKGNAKLIGALSDKNMTAEDLYESKSSQFYSSSSLMGGIGNAIRRGWKKNVSKAEHKGLSKYGIFRHGLFGDVTSVNEYKKFALSGPTKGEKELDKKEEKEKKKMDKNVIANEAKEFASGYDSVFDEQPNKEEWDDEMDTSGSGDEKKE